jgi:hypothetical protein
MSRSYRRPFAAVNGIVSAKKDKKLAHRSARRKQDLTIKTCADYEDLIVPHELECAWNNTYCWGRDGAQRHMGLRYECGDERARRFLEKIQRK